MIITTTPTVEGYNITHYLGTVSGAATYLIGGIFGEGMIGSRQSSQFSAAWNDALEVMKKAAGNADAIVGIQHTLCGVANGYMVVSVTGTAVKLTEDPVYKYQIENAKRELEQARKEQEAKEEQERREQEAKRRELIDHLKATRGERINTFFNLAEKATSFEDIANAWETSHLNGDTAYSEIENEILHRAKKERIYGSTNNNQRVASFVEYLSIQMGLK